jgi:hypothetical protein
MRTFLTFVYGHGQSYISGSTKNYAICEAPVLSPASPKNMQYKYLAVVSQAPPKNNATYTAPASQEILQYQKLRLWHWFHQKQSNFHSSVGDSGITKHNVIPVATPAPQIGNNGSITGNYYLWGFQSINITCYYDNIVIFTW